MANFIGKVKVSNVAPKSLKQLIQEAIDLRFAGKTAAEKNAYLNQFTKWTSDETFLNPQGADITVIDNYLPVQANNASGWGTNITAADMGNFGTVIPDGNNKHYQKGFALTSVLVISSVNDFLLDIDVMIGEL